VSSLTYYALSFGVGGLAGNIYVNHVLMSVVETFAYAFIFCIAWWGRKWPTVGMFLLGGVALLVRVLVTVFAPSKCHGVIFSQNSRESNSRAVAIYKRHCILYTLVSHPFTDCAGIPSCYLVEERPFMYPDLLMLGLNLVHSPPSNHLMTTNNSPFLD